MNKKREPFNIALIDLNHMTVGIHTNTIPLGMGLIAYYLKHNFEHKFDIRIFKNPAVFLDSLKNWEPDVLGITQYVWNSGLNLYAARLLKTRNPGCLVVAGGPNLYLSSPERRNYLQEERFIDLCVSYDGEIPFMEIIKRFIEGESIKDIRRCPPAGTYAVDPISDELVEGDVPAPRLDSLDVFGAMYAEGFFDDLLTEGYRPFVQTHRGCPFRCAYCHTSDRYYSRMIFQSPEYFRRDMEYLGRRFAGEHNVVLEMANTNFGLFDEDFEIARIIREVQDKYDWPKIINVNSGKDPDKLLKLISILKYKFTPAIALQTLTPEVLKNIGRVNISLDKFSAFQKAVTVAMNKNTATELILSLPDETKTTFIETLAKVLNSGVQNIVIYTLMSLRGTPIALPDTRKKYGHTIRYRVVPRCFSEINGVKIFEIEEVVAGTKMMPFNDYMDLRGLALIVTVFSGSVEMFPIRKLLKEENLDIFRWIFGIYRSLPKYPQLYFAYNSFLKETQDELFISKEELVKFFGNQENYDLLCVGRYGDNLLRKYKTVFLSHYFSECLEIVFSELYRLLSSHFDSELIDSLASDLKVYLASRNIGNIFKENYVNVALQRINLSYDIPRWLEGKDENIPLKNYKGKFLYSIGITDYMRNQLKTFRQMNRDPELSLQILYRDGHIKDFWPIWICSKIGDKIVDREKNNV